MDPYRMRPSPVHRLEARVKVLLVLGFLLLSALAPAGAWPVLILLTALLVAAQVLSLVALPVYWRRGLIALPFAAAALPLLFRGDQPFGPALPFDLWLTADGLTRVASITWKALLSVQAALLLTVTTRFPDLLAALQALGVPRLLVSIVGLMWRYLFVLAGEAGRLLRARAARSTRLPGWRAGRGVAWRARITGGMAGSLALRSLDRAERLYQAMLARGYNGEQRALHHPGWTTADRRTLAAGLAALLLLALLSRIGWGGS